MMRGSSPRARAQDVRDTTHDTRHARQDAGAHTSTGWSHWAGRSVSQPLGSESCSFLLILVTHLGQLQSPAGMALSGGSRQWRCQPRSHESHRSILSGLSPCLHLWQISAPTSESSSSSFPVACSHSRHRYASSCQVVAGAHVGCDKSSEVKWRAHVVFGWVPTLALGIASVGTQLKTTFHKKVPCALRCEKHMHSFSVSNSQPFFFWLVCFWRD